MRLDIDYDARAEERIIEAIARLDALGDAVDSDASSAEVRALLVHG
jgi:hypothetical protein